MAGNLQSLWSDTAATNASVDGTVALANGTLFSSDHGAGRAILARIAAFVHSLNGTITSGGAANAQTFTSPSGHAYTALIQGMRIGFIAGFSNSSTVTLAVDGLTAKAVRKNGVTALTSGDIVAGNFYEVIYDAVNGWFQLVSAQTDISGKQPLSAILTAFAALGWTSGNQFPYFTAASALSLGTIGANWLTALAAALGSGWATPLAAAYVAPQPLDSDLTALATYSDAATAGILGPVQCRLTLTTGLAVTVADVTAATTHYATPYKGNRLPLFDGTNWTQKAFTELSQATTDTTKSPAAVAANKAYDIFGWSDSGTLRATRGPAWSSDTARGTGAGTSELVLVNGVYLNANAITNGPVAQRGTYLGTIYSDGSSQLNDSFAKRHVWNMHNRVSRAMRVLESADSWTYSTATIRQANNNAANQIDFVRGLDEDAIEATGYLMTSTSTAADGGFSCLGFDSASAMATGCIAANTGAFNNNTLTGLASSLRTVPGLGRHFVTLLERGFGAGTETFYGDNALPTYQQSGINGMVWA